MRPKQSYVPGTKLYYWNLSPFLAACEVIPSAERRWALSIYRGSVDEHIAAAYDAVEALRRGERIISDLRYVNIVPDSDNREIGWKNPVRAQRELDRFGRNFRHALNEMRGALESLTFEIVTALDDIAEKDGRRLGFSIDRLNSYSNKHPQIEEFARYVERAIGTRNGQNEGFFRVDDLRQVSFHRHIPFMNLDLRWHEANGRMLGKPNSAAWLPDDPWDLDAKYSQNRTVFGTTHSGLWDIVKIIDDGYAVARRTLTLRRWQARRT